MFSSEVSRGPTPSDRFAQVSETFLTTIAGFRRQEEHSRHLQENLERNLIGGRYRIVETLGVGGMGAVYKAFDELDGVDRAIKVAHPEFYASEDGRIRFRQEFLAMASLQHVNLPSVLDYGVAEDRTPYIVMELVPGEPLKTDAPMRLSRFLPLFVQFLRALGFIHDRGFLHRDIKPANTLVAAANDGRAAGGMPETLVLLDFGLMEPIGSASVRKVAGTVSYMAPEVIKGRVLDPRVDLYAMGVTAYELLTGQRPFQHHDVRSLLDMHESAARPHTSAVNADVPQQLDELIAAMMAADPARRPASTDDVLRELSTLTHHVHQSDLASRKAYLRLADFVGREDENAFLRDQLSATETNQGQRCCLLSGRTGSGKSRLLHELHLEALLRRFATAGVEVREEYRAAYQSLAILLRGLIPLALEANCLPQHPRVLHRLLPELFASHGDSHVPVAPQQERGLMIDETTAWISALAEQQPLLLMVDDLQWCDESSLLVMRAMTQRLTSSRVLFLGAFRSDEVIGGSDLDEWRHMSDVSAIDIRGFDDNQMSQFVAGLLGRHSLGETFIRQALSITDGAPFFTIELLRDLIDRDVLLRLNGVWQLKETNVDLPESVSRLVSQRVGRLAPLAQKVALQLAVAGGQLPLVCLLQLFAEDEEEILRAIEELIQSRIAEQSQQTVGLAHDSLRETIYNQASLAQRQAYHQRLGEWFERTLSEDVNERASILGHHFSRGEDRKQGLLYLERAGRAAFEREEHGVARNLLVEAQQLLEELSSCENRRRRLYDVRMMLTIVCVSNDYTLGAELGEWVCQEAVKRSLPTMPFLRRYLPDPLPFLFSAWCHLPLRMLWRGTAVKREFEKDVMDIFRATGYMCNSLASTSKLTSSRRRAERLKAFAVRRSDLALGIMEIAQTIGKYHQEGAAFIDDFRHAKQIFLTNQQMAGLDEYSQNLMLGVCYYAEAISDAWEQHHDFSKTLEISAQFAHSTNNHFHHHLNHQARVENAVYGGDVLAADAAEIDFYRSVDCLGGKSTQREWLVDFAMGLLDVICGRFERAARRSASLLRGGPGYFTEGYGSLIQARLNLEWGQLDDALRHAQTAKRWARDPEVLARLFEFRVQSTIADIALQQLQASQVRNALDAMGQFASSTHRTDYFQIECERREAEVLALSNPKAAVERSRQNLAKAAESASRLQYAEANASLARLMRASGLPDAEADHHRKLAAQVYDELGNQHRAKQMRSNDLFA